MTHDDMLETARNMLERDISLDDILIELRRQGASPISTIKVVRDLKSTSLGEAKMLVHLRKAWADMRVRHDALHATAELAADFGSPYESMFDVGDTIRIETRERLERFQLTWQFHQPLSDTQMHFAGSTAVVKSVGFYHGGDALYELDGIPGMWHEVTLLPL